MCNGGDAVVSDTTQERTSLRRTVRFFNTSLKSACSFDVRPRPASSLALRLLELRLELALPRTYTARRPTHFNASGAHTQTIKGTRIGESDGDGDEDGQAHTRTCALSAAPAAPTTVRSATSGRALFCSSRCRRRRRASTPASGSSAPRACSNRTGSQSATLTQQRDAGIARESGGH